MAPRAHKATYAKDKKNPGKYLIRVEGPNAAKFEDREVPVTMKSGAEQLETLTDSVWAGTDNETGNPVCLYHFVAKPKTEEKPAEF